MTNIRETDCCNSKIVTAKKKTKKKVVYLNLNRALARC